MTRRSPGPRLVLAGPLVADVDVPVLSDLDGKAHGAYGLEGRPALVLVRPDGHIAFRGEAGRTDHLVAYCRRVFGPGAGGDAAPADAREEPVLIE